MPDLLTHALVGYAAGRFGQEYLNWVERRHVTLLMVGAIIPDLNHVSALVPPDVVATALGFPFNWTGLQTGGGVLLVLVAATVTFAPERRRTSFVLLATGAISHLLADAAIIAPDGRAQLLFWPVTQYRPPTPGLYQSTDLWPLVVAATLAAVATVVNRNNE